MKLGCGSVISELLPVSFCAASVILRVVREICCHPDAGAPASTASSFSCANICEDHSRVRRAMQGSTVPWVEPALHARRIPVRSRGSLCSRNRTR